MHPLVALYAQQSQNYSRGAKEASSERDRDVSKVAGAAMGTKKKAKAPPGTLDESMQAALGKVDSRRAERKKGEVK